MRRPFVSRWNVWAAGFGGSQTTDGNAVGGIEHRDQPHRRRRRRRGLLAVAADDRRLRARRRRHQFQRRRWLAPGVPTCSRPAPSCATMSVRPISTARTGLWLAGRHHRPHRDRCGPRAAARAVQRQCVLRPHRRRLSLRDTVDGRPHALRRRTGDDLRSAGLCRERRFRRPHLRAGLRAQRT